MNRDPRQFIVQLVHLIRARGAQLWIAVFSTLGVMLIALVEADRTMPGPISSAHAALEELDQGESCSSCHGGIFSDMTDACLDCHELVESQVSDGSGLHGSLGKEQASSCALCHSEHHGANFQLVNQGSFKRAGIDDPSSFDHALLGFQMEGRHLELNCIECHANAEVEVLEAGQHRFMGLDPSCVRCHDDPHAGRMVRSCEECHSQVDFNEIHATDHGRHLALVGGHGGLDCRTCHAEGQERSLEDLARGLLNKRARNCADCHDSPHAKRMIKGVAKQTGRTAGGSCVECHLESHTSFEGDGAPKETLMGVDAGGEFSILSLSEAVTPRLHAATGFSLEKPHQDAHCSDCHGEPGLSFDDRFADRNQEACSVCHDDPHGGQFNTGLFAGQECTACHQDVRFEPPRFDVDAHRKTSFPLDGSHLTAACNDCHTSPEEDGVRQFHGTKGQCEDCHVDAHQGFFDTTLLTLAEHRAEGACSECHLSTSFSDIVTEEQAAASGGLQGQPGAGRPFNHATWTDFALRGAHAQEACEACHLPREEEDESGRRFGRVEDHFGPFENCESCHADPHEGGFDQHPQNERFKGRTGCQRCHVENSFRSLPSNFNHDLWTGFELEGQHKEISCEACHAPLRRPTELGRTWQHAPGSNCAECHAEPHAGQFARDDVTDCTRCHRSAEAWDVLRFDHDRHSRFPLGDSHRAVACDACHTPWKLESGAEIVRYVPLDTSCASCHGSQQGPRLHRRGRRD